MAHLPRVIGRTVTSTAIATVFGSVLRDFVSGSWLKLAAGAGFIVIGAFMLWSALKPAG